MVKIVPGNLPPPSGTVSSASNPNVSFGTKFQSPQKSDSTLNKQAARASIHTAAQTPSAVSISERKISLKADNNHNESRLWTREIYLGTPLHQEGDAISSANAPNRDDDIKLEDIALDTDGNVFTKKSTERIDAEDAAKIDAAGLSRDKKNTDIVEGESSYASIAEPKKKSPFKEFIDFFKQLILR